MDKKDLRELGRKMNSQNNRCTQHPLFVVQVDKKVPVDESWGYDGYERAEDPYDRDLYCEKCNKLIEDGEGAPDECEECRDLCSENFHFYRVEKDFDLMAGVFLTAEACEEHIRANYYHYYNPRSYAISAWRNYEMQDLMQYLSKLGSDDGTVADFYC